jgi:hypothetical protein
LETHLAVGVGQFFPTPYRYTAGFECREIVFRLFKYQREDIGYDGAGEFGKQGLGTGYVT